ncbi:pollen-specific leucine-rich repeat extensin-like protein 2 [Drosophila subobscura]|uniref:pollen-specific leucine-rich repeat extensin-like protein 2 n=1 Tax=Drosophila subobscura TaxID=7241 RepID=UPI00155A0721|nr:pollen-specific leucine-rich repeat extensin-like protein 2 [Drosophila subobscura]
MLTPCLLLVTVASLGLGTQAIRVDWGTNTGPIAPPPPRTTPQPPQKPYREPAPVWEDQSNDIPNPNPYVYVLPPPSRPRTWAIPAGPYAPPSYNSQPPRVNSINYGQLASSVYSAGVTSVPGLAAQYVPGVGIKYTAIVLPDKLQGKYNAKTKKYKAYEKAGKHASYPWNYLQQLPVEEKALEWQVQLEQQLEEEAARAQQKQALPASSSTTSTTSTTTTTSTSTTTAAPVASSPSPTAAPSEADTDPSSTSTIQPTTIANYKVAHEKSAHLKKLNKQKRLQQLHLELEQQKEKLAKKQQQELQNLLQTS